MQKRQQELQSIDGQQFDVCIVGGGINGAVTAAALTGAGYRVLLVDKGDFAGYTSQHSSNLVWGGIKYLESGELYLVYKLCRSRNRLLRAFPSVIREIRFLTSVAKGFRWPAAAIYLGAIAYWLIGGCRLKRPRLLSAKGLLGREPAVSAPLVSGGVEYSDAYLVDNDARFVFGFIRQAMAQGGRCLNYTRASDFSFDQNSRCWTLSLSDEIAAQPSKLEVSCRYLVNAAGPFVDSVNQAIGIQPPWQHLFSKGVHLIVPAITEVERVLTFFADDGRMFFVIPMGQRSCIGTTDTRLPKLPPTVTQEDRAFILENINKRLALTRPLDETDIISERCGVRPLVVKYNHGEAGDQDWTALSRKHELAAEPTLHYLSVYGGKLTDCLNVGEEVYECMVKMGLEARSLPKDWFGGESGVQRLQFAHDFAEGEHHLEPHWEELLWRRYGPESYQLLEHCRIDPAMAENLVPEGPYLRAEFAFMAHHERVVCLDDLLRRRTKLSLEMSQAELAGHTGVKVGAGLVFGDTFQEHWDSYFRESSLKVAQVSHDK